MKVLIALGGNAMTGPGGDATPQSQIAAAEAAMAKVADLVVAGADVVITHGNGPQVGNLLVKNEIAATVVPPVPLDWCGAQTQATLGFILLDALDQALRLRGADRQMAAIVTRTLVDREDTGFSTRPSRSGGSCQSRRPPCWSSTVRPGRTAAARDGDASSHRRSRLRSWTPAPCSDWWRPGSWWSQTVAAGSRWYERRTDGSVASRR